MLILFACMIHFSPVHAAGNLNLCMIDYDYHNDDHSNPEMTVIQAALPGILIDNTAHGLWGIDGKNGGNGNTNPLKYTPLGIQVYSYITAGDEGLDYASLIDGLSVNLARIGGIASDGATGVFLDEVTSRHLTPEDKLYLSSIFGECQYQNLKLIINVGESTFDYVYLSTVCDYIMTDEAYSGYPPTLSEIGIGLNRCIVVNNACSSLAIAISCTEAAWNYGFGWTWNTDSDQYSLPTYLNSYVSWIKDNVLTNTMAAITPVITTQITFPTTQIAVPETAVTKTNAISTLPTTTVLTPEITGTQNNLLTPIDTAIRMHISPTIALKLPTKTLYWWAGLLSGLVVAVIILGFIVSGRGKKP